MFSKILPEVKSLFKDIKDDILNKDAYREILSGINEIKVPIKPVKKSKLL
jgi:hypothetical protein